MSWPYPLILTYDTNISKVKGGFDPLTLPTHQWRHSSQKKMSPYLPHLRALGYRCHSHNTILQKSQLFWSTTRQLFFWTYWKPEQKNFHKTRVLIASWQGVSSHLCIVAFLLQEKKLSFICSLQEHFLTNGKRTQLAPVMSFLVDLSSGN